MLMTQFAGRPARETSLMASFTTTEMRGSRCWVKSWGQIIEECGARLKFFADRLEYAPDDQSALDYLRQLHAEYLPTQNLGDDGSQMTAVH